MHSGKKTYIGWFVMLGALFVFGYAFLFFRYGGESISSFFPRQGHVIEIRDTGFSPNELHVPLRARVVFKNLRSVKSWPASDLHPSHLKYPEFDAKRAIHPGGEWEFYAMKAGRWGFHDHLAPYFTGMIMVGDDKDMAIPVDICSTYPHTFECWQSELFATLDERGVEATFDRLAELYKTDPKFSASCHYIAHNVGIRAYGKYHGQDDFFTSKFSYCASGFFHGIMESLLTVTQSAEAARKFCAHAGKQLERVAPDAELQCYHGIGHGLMDFAISMHEEENGEEVLARNAILRCNAATKKETERYRCVSGAFNGIANFYITGEQGLKIRADDPLWLCHLQEDRDKESCYGNMNALIMWLGKDELERVARFIANIPEERYAIPAMRYFTGMYSLTMGAAEPDRAVRFCRSVETALRVPCLQGFAHGFIEHGTPGIEYAQSFEFCRAPFMTGDERDTCFHYAIGQLGGAYALAKARVICESLVTPYRQYCERYYDQETQGL